MQKKHRLTRAVVVALACSLAAGPALAASPYQNRDNRGNAWQSQHTDSRHGKHETRRDSHHKTPSWRHKGGRMAGHRNAARVDYRKHHLRQPPKGYHWVKSDDTFVMIAISTGIIASIIAANR